MSNTQSDNAQKNIKNLRFCVIVIIVCLLIIKVLDHKTPLPSPPDEDPLTSLLIQETRSEEYSITNPSSETTSITYTLAKTPYDETDYVSQTLTTALIMANYLFKNTETQLFQITMNYEGAPTTSYIITRDNFLNTDWNSLRTSGHYDEIVPLFQKFFVRDDLMKNVDTSKVVIRESID